LFQAGVGNAYLEAKTKEKVYFVAAGFGDREGQHSKSSESGLCWHEHVADTLHGMGLFLPVLIDMSRCELKMVYMSI